MKKFSIYLFAFAFLLIPLFSFAHTEGTGPGTTPPSGGPATGGGTQIIHIPNPLKGGISTFPQLLALVLNNIVMPIASVAVVMYIVYAGFTFVTAQGKPAEIEAAKKRLLWALIGAGVLLGAAGISKVVENTVNSLIT